jgi:predicted MPP superfamily phosphohydrolase
MIGKFLKHSIRLALLTMKRFPKIRHALQELENTDSFSKFNASRRRFVKTAVYGISGFSFIGSAAGVVDRKGFDVIETNVHLRGLPEGLKETTVGLISDIHAGAFMDKEDIDEYVQTMNGLQPDIIFIPGDFITSVPDEIYPVVESLANMRAKYGIYGCLGNHDFFSHSEDTVVKELENIGIRILRNEHATLEIKGEKLCLIGVDDLSFGGDIGAAMKGADEGLPRILLCHKPYCFEEAAKFNVDVVFSGHTHGGQLVFAKVGDILITPALLASRYIAGKYYSGASTMYVSRGVGTVGIPVRINCPGEITKISLD